MKKTFFKALRAMCVGAMTLAAVSCYDDSALREDLRDLEDEVESIVERLKALESNLNSDATNVSDIEAAVSALQKSFNEAMQANSAEVQKSFDQKLADLKAELEAAVAAGDKANADALAKEKEALEAAMQTLQTSLQDGLAAVTGSVEELEAAIKALEVVVGANYKALLAEMDKKDGVLDGEISNLEAIVDSLKTADKALEAEIVEALAKISVIKATEVDGKVVITFADGSEVELSKPLANVDNNGLVTIVEENGVKFWQIVGEAAHTGVTVGADIEFMVSKENGELFYRVNGGEWVTTGVKAEASDANAVILTGFEDGEDYVKLTIGGVEVVLPKVADFSGASLSRSEAYFVYGATKTTTVSAEGQECYVMNKPDGWKANLVDGVLTVTAPAAELVKSGVADAQGQVLVHVNASNGACTVLKLNVTAGPGMTISYKDGVVTLFNANVSAFTDPMWGDVSYEFGDAWFGLTPILEYAEYESFEDFISSEPEPLSNLQGILFNAVEDQSEYIYIEGEYEEFVASMSLSEAVRQSYSGFEYDENETYVLWVVPQGERNYNYDEAIYVMTGSYVDMVETAAACTNVDFTATLYGADGFAIGALSKSTFDGWGVDGVEFTYEMALAEYLMGNMNDGPLSSFNAGDNTAMGKFVTPGSYDIQLSEMLLPMKSWFGVMYPEVETDMEYFVWVLPYTDGKTDYKMSDLIISTTKTNALVENPELKANVEVSDLTATSAIITVTPVDGATTYFQLLTQEQFYAWYCNEMDGDYVVDTEYLTDDMKYSNWVFESQDVYEDEWLDPATKYVVVLFDQKGDEYSLDYSFTFTTPAAVEYPTPHGKQWITADPAFAAMMDAPEVEYIVDLGVSFPLLYSDMSNDPYTMNVGLNYRDLDPSLNGQDWWASMYLFGSYTIEPTDETSGIIHFMGAQIPYTNLTETTCEFDFAEIFYSPEPCPVEFTASETYFEVYIQ